jgi:DtxR family Mn-dependent transcriptional regulator
MVTLTVENYVKAIYQLCAETGASTASNGDLAKRLGVAPGSVTSMLRTLADSELAHYQAHRGVSLTEAGRRLALRVLRRHRLIELFLSETLGLAWDEVHDEAEHLEHVVSDRLVDRIDEYLNFPQRDPHGDPIPRSDGTVGDVAASPLATCNPGARFVLERVTDQSSEFLRYLSQAGLDIGKEAEVVENQRQAGALIVRTSSGQQLLLGDQAAEKILVRVLTQD